MSGSNIKPLETKIGGNANVPSTFNNKKSSVEESNAHVEHAQNCAKVIRDFILNNAFEYKKPTDNIFRDFEGTRYYDHRSENTYRLSSTGKKILELFDNTTFNDYSLEKCENFFNDIKDMAEKAMNSNMNRRSSFYNTIYTKEDHTQLYKDIQKIIEKYHNNNNDLDIRVIHHESSNSNRPGKY